MRSTLLASLLAAALLGGCSKPPPPPPPPAVAVPKSTAITLRTEPPGATITLDGTALPAPSPQVREFEPDGRKHHAHFELEGHEPGDADFLVALKAEEVMVTLRPAQKLLLETTPPGAKVTLADLDGRLLAATTPADVGLISGAHRLRFELEGHVPMEVEVPEVDRKPLSLKLEAAAFIDVTATPTDGALFIDGKDTHLRTPAAHVAVSEGKVHRIEVRGEGIRSRAVATPKLKAGATHTVAAKLQDLEAKEAAAELKRSRKELAEWEKKLAVLEKEDEGLIVKDLKRAATLKDRLAEAREKVESLSLDVSHLEEQVGSKD